MLQSRQGRGHCLAAVSTATVYQDRGVLFRDHCSYGGFFGSSYQQEDSVGDVTAVAFVLRPCIHDDGFLGVRQLPGLLLADLPVGGRCIVPAIFG